MFKKIVAGLALVCAIPIMAHAWTMNTWVKTGGGTITVRDGKPQSSVNGSVFKTYTTSSANPNNRLDIVVSANTGYAIKEVTVNGAQIVAPPSPYTVSVAGSRSQSVWATFKPSLITVTASAGDGGRVSPNSLSSIRSGQVSHLPVRFQVTPVSGFKVSRIDGLPAGAAVSCALPAPQGKAVVVTLPRGFVFNNSIAISASFSGSSASAGPPQTVKPGSHVVLDGSGSLGATTFSWKQTSGPGFPTIKAIPDGTSGSRVSFTAASVGTYSFRLTVNGGATAFTSVVVTGNAAKTGRSQCQNCHQSNYVGSRDNVFTKWSSSRHNTGFVMCAKCHVGVDTGGHPGPALTSQTLLNACNGCHIDPSGNVPNHPISSGAALCVSCHDPHSTTGSMAGVPAAHFNNATSAGYPASYLTSRSSCTDCHRDGAQNGVIRKQWDQSGHAATTEDPWKKYDFKTRSGCVQCHTTTGFIAYSTGKVTAAWGRATDKTKELLTCKGCHSDVATGALRSVKPVQAFADAPYLNHDLGKSNICMGCHSGRNNGSSISLKVGNADFGNLPFIAPHYLAAGGVIQGQSGYHFPGQSYSFYSSNSHRVLGVDNQSGTGYSGPCIACHMSSSEKHLYQAVKMNRSGAITAITANFCTNCHGTSLSFTALRGKQRSFDNALEILKAMLADKGFVYSSDYPYFSTTDWGSGQAGADAMGAAFNYMMLLSEPGAYAHNPAYAKKLIADSIDVLYHGSVTGSIDEALNYLVQKGAITKAAAGSLNSYTQSNCTGCHGGTTATPTPIVSNGHAIHLTKSYGPGSYLGSDLGSCQTCHVYGVASHANGAVEILSDACSGCHPSGAPFWTDNSGLECISCHAETPATLPNGVAAPYKAAFRSSGHGRYSGSNECMDCHDSKSPHISGSLGTYKRLIVDGNALCASCHTRKVKAQYLNMVTHNGMTCVTCHDPHGTGNLSMIRSSLNGSPIVYTNRVALVDGVTDRGICQVCHSTTKYYRAGVPENSHFTSRCLECHLHNAADNAFAPIPQGN